MEDQRLGDCYSKFLWLIFDLLALSFAAGCLPVDWSFAGSPTGDLPFGVDWGFVEGSVGSARGSVGSARGSAGRCRRVCRKYRRVCQRFCGVCRRCRRVFDMRCGISRIVQQAQHRSFILCTK